MYIVLLGAPGSGKGTVGKLLSEKLHLAHISTGDIFRENLKNETDLGLQAKQYMDKGELVPDEVTINMLKERLKGKDTENGAILDGFPRTTNQAIALDKMLTVDMALNINVPFEEIIQRIAKRRTCKSCGEIYNLAFNPPKQANICDKCGGELYQRDDEKEDIVKNRLEVYQKSSQELIEYYKEKNTLNSVDAGDKAGKTSYDVAEEVEKVLNK